MSIKVNIRRVNRALPTNDAGLTLAILKEATPKAGIVLPVRINTIEELYNTFEVTTAKPALFSAEYLLSTGANLIVLTDTTQQELEDAFDEFRYKQIVAPYLFAELETVEDEKEVPEDITNLINFVEDPRITVQLYLDLNPEASVEGFAADYGAVIDGIKAALPNAKLAKLELCANSGMPLFTSRELDLHDFGTNDFYGVGASMALAARKAQALLNNRPWFPIAGETNGAVAEFGQLLNKYNNAEKEAIQALNINLLMNKPGFGPLFVSQNTQFINPADNPTEPLLRSHVVTEALWIKRELERLSGPIEHMPNNTRYQAELEILIKKFLREVFEKDGLEQPAYVNVVGSGTTMTGNIEYIPIKATEAVILNVAIVDNTGAVNVVVDGGNL